MTPPRLAERLLHALVPDAHTRDAILGDLAEEWADRAGRDGRRAAARWYWAQALRSVPPLLRERRRPSVLGDHRTPVGPSWLDIKLGVRMLVKHPGLTLVSGLAIAVAVAVGAGWFEFSRDYFHPSLPLSEGDRVVGIQNWDTMANAPDRRVLHDFEAWRAQLRTVEELGASRTPRLNLITSDGQVEPVLAAEISASAFRLVRVPPLLGRGLVDGDERAEAPSVAVIGYGIWQRRFGGDSSVIGRTVRVGEEPTTIVGVMPDGFAFPATQSLWLPLRLSASDYERGEGPSLLVFGRLVPGTTLELAQAELTAIGQRTTAAFPATNAKLRPRVTPYIASIMNEDPEMQMAKYGVQAVFTLILVIAGGNVATLVYARTATRQREIAVRRALGASRGRIVGQLFAEALVLSSLAAAVGLAVVWWAQGWGMDIFWGVQGGTQNRPFWWDSGLSPATSLYVAALAVLAAIIAGVLPAVKATGGHVQARLQQTAADASGLRFGGLWTGIVVVQVALSVIALPFAASAARETVWAQAGGLGFAAERFLSVQLTQSASATAAGDSSSRRALLARYRQTYQELQRRLATESGVVAVTMATKLPGTEPSTQEIEVEDVPGALARVSVSSVALGLFAAFDAPILAGRDFTASDAESGRAVVIVNESFVRERLGGRSPLGRRVRVTADEPDGPGLWHEIVGVVPDLAMDAEQGAGGAGFYRPLDADAYPVQLAVRLRGDAAAFTPRLRAVAAALDPTLQVMKPITLAESAHAMQRGVAFLLIVIVVVSAVALLLATVGIYALMSFTVAQRTREIGIRIALGASSRRILWAVLARAFAQLSLGVVLGSAVLLLGSDEARETLGFMLAVIGLVVGVGLLACALPVRRVLRVQPTEALRAGD